MGGRIKRIGEALEPAAGGEVLDAAGRLVCPGLVDLHLHCYFRGHVLGIDADALAGQSRLLESALASLNTQIVELAGATYTVGEVARLTVIIAVAVFETE